MCEDQGLGLSSCLQRPPVTRLTKIRVSRPSLVARAEAGRDAGPVAVSSLQKLLSGSYRYPNRDPSEFLQFNVYHDRMGRGHCPTFRLWWGVMGMSTGREEVLPAQHLRAARITG